MNHREPMILLITLHRAEKAALEGAEEEVVGARVGFPRGQGQAVFVFVGDEISLRGDSLECVSQARITQRPVQIACQRRYRGLALRAPLTRTEVFDRRVLEEQVSVSKTGRDPDPFVEVVASVGRHVVGNDFAQGGRAFANVQNQVQHVAVHRPDQLPHVWIPLKVKSPNRVGPGEAFVGLIKLDPVHEGGQRAGVKIALAEVLGKEPAVIAKAGEADHLDFRQGELLDGQ